MVAVAAVVVYEAAEVDVGFERAGLAFTLHHGYGIARHHCIAIYWALWYSQYAPLPRRIVFGVVVEAGEGGGGGSRVSIARALP